MIIQSQMCKMSEIFTVISSYNDVGDETKQKNFIFSVYTEMKINYFNNLLVMSTEEALNRLVP